MTKQITVIQFLDQFPTYLRELLGTNNVALSYVIRPTNTVPAVLPVLVPLKPWCALHTSLMEELITYTPHNGPSFDAGNARVYA